MARHGDEYKKHTKTDYQVGWYDKFGDNIDVDMYDTKAEAMKWFEANKAAVDDPEDEIFGITVHPVKWTTYLLPGETDEQCNNWERDDLDDIASYGAVFDEDFDPAGVA